MTAREAICKALSTVEVMVDGVARTLVAEQFPPDTISAWHAWPDWTASTWITSRFETRTWQVVVVLPAASPATFTAAAEALIQPVRDALEAVAHVERCAPTSVSTGNSATHPALYFELATPGS